MRDDSLHIERWMLDGHPIWARTFEVDRSPGGITDIAVQEGTRWVHSVGFHSWNGDRDWYYDRRYVVDGFHYNYNPGDPRE